MVEKIARAIAGRNGDDYDKIPKHKSDWTANGGMFGGRFRDVNEPYQTDYDEMARAALEAMREPTLDMIEAGQEQNNLLPDDRDPPNAFEFLSRDEMTNAWQAMIEAALSPSGEK
ncbi:MAG: hypothetical protein RLW68_00740 [Devosia marina]|uniref:hypothetical protein n=1 Tax=Devosia marina TaxID=2683198 RepID=UPI0032EE470D